LPPSSGRPDPANAPAGPFLRASPFISTSPPINWISVFTLRSSPRKGFISLRDFEHGTPRNRIENLSGDAASFFGTTVPMLRLVKELFSHCCSGRILAPGRRLIFGLDPSVRHPDIGAIFKAGPSIDWLRWRVRRLWRFQFGQHVDAQNFRVAFAGLRKLYDCLVPVSSFPLRRACAPGRHGARGGHGATGANIATAARSQWPRRRAAPGLDASAVEIGSV
jgi:hypothetical protein